MIINNHQAQHFDISSDDLDFCSKSQLYEKSKTSVSIFLQILHFIYKKFSILLQLFGLLKLVLVNLFAQVPYKGDSSSDMVL